MHIEFLVEEESVEAALQILIPKLVGNDVTFKIHAHQGKPDLLGKLAARLRGYRHWALPDCHIVVLVDEDRQPECERLKRELEEAAQTAGLITKSGAKGGVFQVVNRIAVEELEAWFFGDAGAIASAYPGVVSTLDRKAKYRDPDAIKGGTAEALERVLRRAGYFPAGMPKVAVARAISAHMVPERNRSRSFQIFRQGLLACVGGRP